MGRNVEKHIDLIVKTPVLRTRRFNRPTPFVMHWRALQHELAFNTARLDRFLTEISNIMTTSHRVSTRSGKVTARFER